MFMQSISDYFFTEYLHIAYFIIVVLGSELSAFFIYQHIKRGARSPRSILAFSVTMLAFTTAYLLRALNDLLFNNEPMMTDLIYQIDMIIVSACSIANSCLMIDFFKMRRIILRVVSIVCLILGIISTIISILATIAKWGLQTLVVVLAGITLVIDIFYPMYLMVEFAKREESGLKKLLWLVIVGIIILFIGMLFNFKFLDNTLKSYFQDSYDIFKIVILIIIIVGLTMIELGAFYLPPFDDFLWMDDLLALYVFDKSTRMILFKKIFDLKTITALPFANKDIGNNRATEDTFLEGVGGISDMLSETLQDSEEKVELIDQGAVKLLLTYEGSLIFILLAKQKLPILNWKLNDFKDTFILFYGDLVERFANNPEKFAPVEELVSRIFRTKLILEKKADKS
jgi:hypothetical protein